MKANSVWTKLVIASDAAEGDAISAEPVQSLNTPRVSSQWRKRKLQTGQSDLWTETSNLWTDKVLYGLSDVEI